GARFQSVRSQAQMIDSLELLFRTGTGRKHAQLEFQVLLQIPQQVLPYPLRPLPALAQTGADRVRRDIAQHIREQAFPVDIETVDQLYDLLCPHRVAAEADGAGLE